MLSSVPRTLFAINSAVSSGLGGERVIQGVLTMGMLTAFQSLMKGFLSPVNRLVNLGGTLSGGEGRHEPPG